MPTLKDRITELVQAWPGLTDREITDRLVGASAAQQSINQIARSLSDMGQIVRRARPDGKLGNYPIDQVAALQDKSTRPAPPSCPEPSEDDVKRAVEAWLVASGWRVTVKWGKTQGIDIEAQRGNDRWIIEAKGCGSRNAMRVNYFVAMLGELLQRMNDPQAQYSVALPDMKQFRALWQRFPDLAKSRTTMSALFVDSSGRVEEVDSVSVGPSDAARS